MFSRLEVFDGVSASGTGLEVELVGVCLVFVAEGNGCFNVPRRKLGSMRHMACIVHGKPLLQVLRGACVMVAACGAVAQDVDIVKLLLGMHGVKMKRLFNAHAARFRPGGLQRGSLLFLAFRCASCKKKSACQAEVLSPKERRLELKLRERRNHQRYQILEIFRTFRFPYFFAFLQEIKYQ